MSSLDDFPDWSVFADRAVPSLDVFSPVSEIAALLQRYRADLDMAQEHTESVRREGLEALAQQAVFVVQLEYALERYKPQFEQASLNKVYRSLRIVKDQMLDALRSVGMTIIVPHGKSFDEVSAYVNVVGWQHSQEFTEEVVVEVLQPIILYHTTIIRLGQVVMGAPLEQEPQTVISNTDNVIHT
jgi:molecular chaperone GrpE (heat shock protein)